MFDNCQIGDPLGVGSGISWNPPGGAVVVANPNLLLWTDELDNAVWAKTTCLIFADLDPPADEWLSVGPTSAIRQVSGAVAATGIAATATGDPGFGSGIYTHVEVGGSFDGQLYTFSGEFNDAGGSGDPITLRIDRSGGFLRCSMEDPGGTGDVIARHFQLQAGPFTSYQHRGGV